MHVSAVEGPTGEAVFTMGGPRSWKTAAMKGWCISLEWAKSGRKFPRVLVIWPEGTPLAAKGTVKPGAWCISHTSMVLFLEFDKDGLATGKPSDLCFIEAGEALEMLGKDRNDKQALFSLVDVVIRYGLELAEMPVAPMHIKRLLSDGPMWDMTEVDKSSGKTVREASV